MSWRSPQCARSCAGVRRVRLTLPRCGPADTSMCWRSIGSRGSCISSKKTSSGSQRPAVPLPVPCRWSRSPYRPNAPADSPARSIHPSASDPDCSPSVGPFRYPCPRPPSAAQRRAARLSHPASLAVQPAHPVRSFERVALTPSAFRISAETAGRSVATASLRFPAALADRPGLLSGRSPA
jgi:hypothetical protein